MKTSRKILDILRSPVAVIIGILAGFFIGFRHEDLAGMIAPAGKMYLAFLNMCILPIIITLLISGIAKIIRSPEISGRFPVILFGFVALLIIPGIAGTITALIGRPGKMMDNDELSLMGSMISGSQAAEQGNGGGLADLIVGIIPWNLFESLGKGQTMSIVFACVFIGMGAGFVRKKGVDDLISIIDATFDVFNMLFKWALTLLPIGVLCVIANQVSGFSPSIFETMLEYIIPVYLGVLILIFLYILIMSFSAGIPFKESLKAMKDPLFLAFTVDSSFIAIKPCLDSLERIPGVDSKTSSMLVPFGVVTNRQGKIFIFAFTSIFLAQLYGVELGVSRYAAVIVGSALAGMAAPGSGALLAPMAAVVIESIGVPSALAFVIFTINGPIVDRILSALTVQGSCVLASLAGDPERAEEQKISD